MFDYSWLCLYLYILVIHYDSIHGSVVPAALGSFFLFFHLKTSILADSQKFLAEPTPLKDWFDLFEALQGFLVEEWMNSSDESVSSIME